MMAEVTHDEPTVVCVLRSGEFRGRHYTPEWVQRLKAQVAQHIGFKHRFVCFSDVERIEGVEVFPLRYGWPGWWSKIEVFRWNADARLLYLDLDVRIVGSLDDLINWPAPIVLAPALVTKPKPRMVRRYQSSVMAWTPPNGKDIYSKFVQCPQLNMHKWYGDQDWIGHIKPDCATFPVGWVTKRVGLHTRVMINVKDHEQAQPRIPALS